jgi:glycosyltransferase involved in cell wall biosynthesis
VDIRLIRLLSEEEFDIVQLESLFMTPYIPTIRRYSKARVVLRSHNLEHVIQERIATGERNILKRPYRRFLARQLHQYEIAVLDRLDGVAAISPADSEHFASHGTRTPIATIPFAVDPGEYPVDKGAVPANPVFFHLGSMDWLPNEEGIRWLLETVWPRVVRKRPKAELHLAGNKMPADLLGIGLPGVQVKGRVKNALNFMRARHVMVVPLFSAGGMRVKIIEGMAMGKAIVSTPIGAEGIAHTAGENILIARNANEFTEHMTGLLDHPERIAAIGAGARALVEAEYTDARIIRDLEAFYKRLLKR